MADMAFACPNCGNTENFLVKTLQMHIVRVGESGLDVTEEGFALGYEFDIVLRGREATPMEI